MITDWNKYIQYLKNWAEEHSDQVYDGSSPSCYAGESNAYSKALDILKEAIK